MTNSSPTPPPAGTGAHLLVNSPIAAPALARLVHTVGQLPSAARALTTNEAAPTTHPEATASAAPPRVLDIGCGWGEVLIQVLQALPRATGHGLDIHEPDIARARELAARRGVGERVTFSAANASMRQDGADVVINLGAYHALGEPAAALADLHTRTSPGGRVLFGLEYWRTRPTSEELAHMWPGAHQSDCLYLPDLVTSIQDAGWRILDWHDSTQSELDAYEVNLWREREEWLLDYPSHPLRAELDTAWSGWLRGHRRAMGFVTVVLGRMEPGSTEFGSAGRGKHSGGSVAPA